MDHSTDVLVANLDRILLCIRGEVATSDSDELATVLGALLRIEIGVLKHSLKGDTAGVHIALLLTAHGPIVEAGVSPAVFDRDGAFRLVEGHDVQGSGKAAIGAR